MNDLNNEYGEECATCQCLICEINEVACNNCKKCNGCNGYNRWKMDCNKYKQCKNPEENIKIILKDII